MLFCSYFVDKKEKKIDFNGFTIVSTSATHLLMCVLLCRHNEIAPCAIYFHVCRGFFLFSFLFTITTNNSCHTTVYVQQLISNSWRNNCETVFNYTRVHVHRKCCGHLNCLSFVPILPCAHDHHEIFGWNCIQSQGLRVCASI